MTPSSGSPTPSPGEPEPRLRAASPYDDTLGGAVAEAARAMGYDLLPWQERQVRDWAAVNPDGTWVHQRCGSSIPRQAGKSVDGIVWAATLASLMGYKVLWTDHNYATTCEMLGRFRDIFGSRPADPSHGIPAFNRLLTEANSKTAQEWFKFRGGGMLAFSTRTKSAALGFSFDVVVYDEAQELTGAHVQAIMPTTTSGSKHNPQTLYLGTPTRAGSVAEVFQDVRSQAWSGGAAADDLCWLEYGVAEVGDVTDESRWYGANPSLGHHADVRAIRSACRTMAPLAFAQEYLGYWLPKVADAVLTKDEWDACRVDAADAPREGGRVAYGVKFSADGSTVALAAARRLDSGTTHVELVACEPTSRGTSWLADWLAARTSRACCAAIDGLSGAGDLCDRLAAAGAPRNYAVRPRAAEAVDAASMTLDAVRCRQLTHIEGPALDLSATTSTRRPIGRNGGWGWGGQDPTPIDAASLALWAARTSRRNPTRKGLIG